MGNDELEKRREARTLSPSVQSPRTCAQPSGSKAPSAASPPARRRRKRGRRRRSTSSSSSSSSSSTSSDSSSESDHKKKRRHWRRQKKGGGKQSRKIDELSQQVHDLREKLTAKTDYTSDISLHPCEDCEIGSPQLTPTIDKEISNVPKFQLDISTKLKEPTIPKTSESDLKQLHDVQLFDNENWSELRYADTQKLYVHSPGFTELEPNEEVKAYDTLRHLSYADKVYAALTLCMLKQRQTLQDTLRDLLFWAKDTDTINFDSLNDKVADLFSEGSFQKTSSDLLQLICGHRAEVIQMRRDGVLAQVKDPLMKATLRKIPPSCRNLFSADAFTTAVEKAGGVRKCFWPLQKKSASSLNASQAGPSKATTTCPSHGKAQHILPSQGTNCRSCANVSNAHVSVNQSQPSQGIHNHTFPSQGRNTSWQTNSQGGWQTNQPNFHGQNPRPGQRSHDQYRGGRKRPSSSSGYRGNKRRKY